MKRLQSIIFLSLFLLNTSYSLVLDNANNGVTAGTVYKCRIKVKYTTFHENSANDTIHYSSIDSNTRMAYKMTDDFLQLTNNKITTDGENVKLELNFNSAAKELFDFNPKSTVVSFA